MAIEQQEKMNRFFFSIHNIRLEVRFVYTCPKFSLMYSVRSGQFSHIILTSLNLWANPQLMAAISGGQAIDVIKEQFKIIRARSSIGNGDILFYI